VSGYRRDDARAPLEREQPRHRKFIPRRDARVFIALRSFSSRTRVLREGSRECRNILPLYSLQLRRLCVILILVGREEI